MATTQIVEVVVEELSKFGYKANGKYVGLSKNLSEADKTRLVPGATFEAEYYIADSGKEYLNKILSATVPSATTPKAAVDTEQAKKFTPKYEKKADAGEAMTRKDWDSKDRRISRQGIIQVCVQVQSDWEEAVKLAEKMLEFVNG